MAGSVAVPFLPARTMILSVTRPWAAFRPHPERDHWAPRAVRRAEPAGFEPLSVQLMLDHDLDREPGERVVYRLYRVLIDDPGVVAEPPG